jgi:GMP synthase (glutamine-hydrolysing)
LSDPEIKGIIFTGGPNSVYDPKLRLMSIPRFSRLGKPILGICYGAQLMAYELGGKVEAALIANMAKPQITLQKPSSLLQDVHKATNVFMSHNDQVMRLPEGFYRDRFSASCPNAAFENDPSNLYATQFHPEVVHSEEGQRMLENFRLSDLRVEAHVEERFVCRR